MGWSIDERNLRGWLSSERSTLCKHCHSTVITRSECLTITYLPVRSTGLGSHCANCRSRSPLLLCGGTRFEFQPDTNCSEVLRPFLPTGINFNGSPHPESAESTLILFLWTSFCLYMHVSLARGLFSLPSPNKICMFHLFPHVLYTSSPTLHWQFKHTLISDKEKRCGTLLCLIHFAFLGPVIILSVLFAHNLCSDSNRLQICALYVPTREKSATVWP